MRILFGRIFLVAGILLLGAGAYVYLWFQSPITQYGFDTARRVQVIAKLREKAKNKMSATCQSSNSTFTCYKDVYSKFHISDSSDGMLVTVAYIEAIVKDRESGTISPERAVILMLNESFSIAEKIDYDPKPTQLSSSIFDKFYESDSQELTKIKRAINAIYLQKVRQNAHEHLTKIHHSIVTHSDRSPAGSAEKTLILTEYLALTKRYEKFLILIQGYSDYKNEYSDELEDTPL